MSKTLIVSLAERKGINFIQFFKFVSLHQSILMVISWTLIAKIKLFRFAENSSNFILTLGTLIITVVELPFISYGEVDLVSDEILTVRSDEEVVLEGIFLRVFFD